MTYPNWFAGAQYNFETHLAHFKGKPDIKFIQIGAFTGDATVWLLDNILTNEFSLLIDVDTWEGSDEEEHKKMNFEDVFSYYKKRTGWYPNLSIIQSKSEDYLPRVKKDTIDFIYIDGDHTEKAVNSDIKNSWPLLKSGGILAFDDYLWRGNVDCPKPAIDKFLEEHSNDIVLLEQGYQVWVRKK
jgi:predicted O-methyltransferase YrrM